MIYLCAGIFAEGKSDYAFLIPLVNRLLFELSTSTSQATEVAESVGIDARRPAPKRRADRISAAIQEYQSQCTLFVIHADEDGDFRAALAERVDPGRGAAAAVVKAPIVACIPIREIEAWLLSDRQAFTALLPRSNPELPRNAEADSDPKQTLTRIYGALGLRGEYHAFFGENVELEALRRLSAFRIFEDELRAAVDSMGQRNPG